MSIQRLRAVLLKSARYVVALRVYINRSKIALIWLTDSFDFKAAQTLHFPQHSFAPPYLTPSESMKSLYYEADLSVRSDGTKTLSPFGRPIYGFQNPKRHFSPRKHSLTLHVSVYLRD
eukprot:GEMP01129899.1.p1 GENE.GEMP01129899.1~~GEMP01129899.1.p1  ORF type:complete len:118 (-),score=2.22 GEMP01129899.1:128-481(-)